MDLPPVIAICNTSVLLFGCPAFRGNADLSSVVDLWLLGLTSVCISHTYLEETLVLVLYLMYPLGMIMVHFVFIKYLTLD